MRNHEQVRANEGAISQSNLPPLQSVQNDEQEQVRTGEVVAPVSGPLSSDGSNDHDQAIAHSASFPCGSTASSFQSLPVSNSFEMPQPMAIGAQQNCVRSSVSTQEMDHPVLTVAFPNDEEVEYSSVRPEHFKNAAKEEGRELMTAMVTRIDVIAEDNFDSPNKVLLELREVVRKESDGKVRSFAH